MWLAGTMKDTDMKAKMTTWVSSHFGIVEQNIAFIFAKKKDKIQGLFGKPKELNTNLQRPDE